MKFDVALQTDIGCVRSQNQDALCAFPEQGIFIVCDGMGGHQAGEVASQMTCDHVGQSLLQLSDSIAAFATHGHIDAVRRFRQAMSDSILQANNAVFNHGASHVETRGMGTTCTAVWVLPHNKVIMGHVGDSRLYLQRQGVLYQLSSDHTYVNELVKRKAIEPQEADNHPQGHMLARALGTQPNIAVDTLVFDLDPHDTLLLTSDGLHEYFVDTTHVAQVLAANDLNSGLDSLIQDAKTAGGHDNLTGLALRLDPASIQQSEPSPTGGTAQPSGFV